MTLSHRLYYALKPYLPWRLRMALRRWRAQRIRRQAADVWPIDEAAGRRPDGWPGWPDGKQFAFVITHDVEGPEGLANVRRLAELEMSLGFRSSFNFIPEGPYRVPDDLRAWLTNNGFEVGVHDLNHDGKLYSSRDGFRRKAERINRYLRAWGAVGYRSGFMLRRPEWHHDLAITYDATSFDTDPFEPMPRGAGTIFPFWVPGAGRAARCRESGVAGQESRVRNQGSGDTRHPTPDSEAPAPRLPDAPAPAARPGFVELPYTLAQDSSLFLILRERDPRLWLEKLDWIARKGGMALVNIHPDYIDFDSKGSCRHYPVSHVVALLENVRDRFATTAWRALPRDVADSAARSVIPPRPEPSAKQVPGVAQLGGRNVAVLLFSGYPSDPRPRRAAEAMAGAGARVEVICIREAPGDAARESVQGVSVRRLPIGKTRGGKLSYFVQYGSFIAACFALLAWRTLRRRYDVVHVHNMPDVLAFAALVPKLRGARVILDLHDPMPELMTSIYGLDANHWLVGLLRAMERWSIAFADRVITVNRACRKIFSARSCAASKVEVVMNAPDERIFTLKPPAPPASPERPWVIMFHGSIVERHGLDLAVIALGKLRQHHPGAILRIYGARNSYLDQVLQQAERLGLADAVHALGPVNQSAIARAIDECDIGIIPNRRSIFTEINTPTRIFEYLARGKAVIAPDSPGITDYFGPDELLYFRLGDVDDLARALVEAASSPADLRGVIERGQAILRQHRWTEERARLIDVTRELLDPGASGAPAAALPAK